MKKILGKKIVKVIIYGIVTVGVCLGVVNGADLVQYITVIM